MTLVERARDLAVDIENGREDRWSHQERRILLRALADRIEELGREVAAGRVMRDEMPIVQEWSGPLQRAIDAFDAIRRENTAFSQSAEDKK